MATLTIKNAELTVTMSPWENVGALHRDVSVPLSSVVEVEYVAKARGLVRGLRSPGTGVPGRILLGTFRTPSERTFAAAYGNGSGYVVRLRAAGFDRLVVTMDRSAPLDELAAELAGAGVSS